VAAEDVPVAPPEDECCGDLVDEAAGRPRKPLACGGISEPHVKSPGPTKIHWSTMPMTVVAVQ